jgi:hypothetical protein
MTDLLQSLTARVKQIGVPVLRTWILVSCTWRNQMAEVRKYRRWIVADKAGPPPPLYNQDFVRSTGHRWGIATLVETGTFAGRMVEAVDQDFDRSFTIALDPTLSPEAERRFHDRPHITVLHRDSGQLLPKVLGHLDGPAVFWLDAHYSGGQRARGDTETPIMHELSAIAGHRLYREHALLIDDAREFSGSVYPTLDFMGDWVRSHGYETVIVEDDIIRIYNAEARGAKPPSSSAPAWEEP